MGFSQTDMAARRKAWKKLETLLYIQGLILDTGIETHISGSRMEGVGTGYLGSDIDEMHCQTHCRPIYDTAEWEFSPTFHTFLIDTSDIHIGYCRLVGMNNHEPTFLNIGSVDYWVPTADGRLTLSNKFIKPSEFQYRHGPAITSKLVEDNDQVCCYHCKWPSAAREWLTRKRAKNFPPRDVILSAEQRGVHVVPVGYKYSQFQESEWRFSFSLLECQIMGIMPTAALKCYVVLKLLKKEMGRIIPELPDLISSYHIITILFWLVEETGTEYWSEQRLLECIELFINRLIEYLLHGEIPHYFLRENNLLDSRITETLKTQIMAFFHQIVSDRSQLFQTCFSILDSTAKNIDNYHPEQERVTIDFETICLVFQMPREILMHASSRDSATFCRQINTVVAQLTSLSVHCDQEINETLEYLMNHIRQKCGSCLLSQLAGTKLSNSTCFRLINILEQMVRCGSDRNGKLTLAIFYYKIEQYIKVLDVLHDVHRWKSHFSV